MEKAARSKKKLLSAGLWFLSATCYTASALIGKRLIDYILGLMCTLLGCVYFKEYNKEK